MSISTEDLRVKDTKTPWKKWGPYLSERQWGTVREDYSENGNAWDYFTHDMARSRSYLWGEDGIGGISDDKQIVCLAFAFWNHHDPIIKERFFGLSNSEGNHGEDVKEYYYYLDNTPTHSYMKMLYKYPHKAYPYNDLVLTNRNRTRFEPEYELVDTGVFANNAYFDILIEYAKETPEDLLIQVTLFNRGEETAEIDVLPTVWFRNSWENSPKPSLVQKEKDGQPYIEANSDQLGSQFLLVEGCPPFLFTENETNRERLFQKPNQAPYVKDGINEYLVHGQKAAVNPEQTGTKASALYSLSIPGKECKILKFKWTSDLSKGPKILASDFQKIFAQRKSEADEFYARITPRSFNADQSNVLRQSYAGMLWSKQYYCFDGDRWLDQHGSNPFKGRSRKTRNADWFHMYNSDIISMPDKWEYPWYAAWDLAFQAIALTTVDLQFSKGQIELILSERYLHPSGQIPAYEWNFSDVNPPVHAWAALFIYRMESNATGIKDLDFLKRVFGKLLLNFTWWVNRKDMQGKNIFEGGFLGLDNIGVFDRSSPLPIGGHLEQADGTAWMVMFCLCMVEIAAELSAHDPVYDDLAIKFIDHFLFIASAINRIGEESSGLWDSTDCFYYDMVRTPEGKSIPLKVRSIVGLLPLCSVTCLEKYHLEKVPHILEHLSLRLKKIPELSLGIHPVLEKQGHKDRMLLSLLDEEKLKKTLAYLLDEEEFLSPYGIRALSKFHQDHPYLFEAGGSQYRVEYVPGESNSGMFGGNSNWRGPIWAPIGLLILRSLLQYYLYYGDRFKVECPTRSGNFMNLFDVSKEISRRMSSIFLENEEGKRPVFGNAEKFQSDPLWKDFLLFYEYFHGDTGQGLGASHQTGWTGTIPSLMRFFNLIDGESLLEEGKKASWLFRSPIKPEAPSDEAKQ